MPDGAGIGDLRQLSGAASARQQYAIVVPGASGASARQQYAIVVPGASGDRQPSGVIRRAICRFSPGSAQASCA